ncbi:MAG: hypothetical protein QW598_01580 [Pyrobaculum sp.]
MLSPGVLLLRLSAARALALRRGVWFRVRPPARALIEAVLLHLKRGGKIRSVVLLKALEAAVREALSLALPLRVRAKALGYAIARRLGVEVDEEKALALGLQWINTPRRYRTAVDPLDAPG